MQHPLSKRNYQSWETNRKALAHELLNISVRLWSRCRMTDKLSVLSEPRHARRIRSYYIAAETRSVSSVFITRSYLRWNAQNRHPFHHLPQSCNAPSRTVSVKPGPALQVQGPIRNTFAGPHSAEAYAENFHGGDSFRGIWWSFAFGVRCLWRHNLTSYSCVQTNVFTKFVDTMCIFFYTHLLCVMCHSTEYKLSALQVTTLEENKLNATTQQFIIAKISGCALKQRRKTHSTLRQSNLQLQNQAALSCWIRAVEHRKYAAVLFNTHPDMQDWIMLNYTRIENALKVRKKTFDFLLCI